MQSPITIGTILQNRYRLTKLLGHGSMLRTYLAEDQGRFNELCTLQEIIPAPVAESMFEKLKELFLRETAILYQIQHPQIPQVRATFERDRRLFLVQDYIEGTTLSTLLSERRSNNQTFTEADVLLLLEQLLPVLAYLHSQGIVHQGISPNNIILREQTPVLSKFGIIKSLAARLQSPSSKYQLVPIGVGYAPIEQILQTGICPSSDLYALAVTALVLLTGLELQELFDRNTQSWRWQQHLTLSPQTNEMLHRMLSYRPSDRYQSVSEVEQVLQYINSIPQIISSDLPWGQPVIAHPVEHSSIKPNQSEPVPVVKRKVWDKPWAVILIYLGVAIFTGVSSGVVVSSLFAKQRLTERPTIAPQNFPSPLVESSTPIPTSSAPPSTDRNSQRLTLKPGQRTTIRGSLKAKVISYIFHGEQGQQLSATLTNDNTLLSVLGLDQAPIDDNAKRVTRYQGTLPSTGDYTIELSPVLESSTKYRLIIRLGAAQSRSNELNSTTPDTPSVTSPKSSR